MLRIATFLDPRFKDLSLFIPEEQHECVYENTKTELLSVVRVYDDDDEVELVDDQLEEGNEPEPPKKEKKVSY